MNKRVEGSTHSVKCYLSPKHHQCAVDRIAALEAELDDYKITVRVARLRGEETGRRVNELEAELVGQRAKAAGLDVCVTQQHDAITHLRTELATALLEHEIGNQAEAAPLGADLTAPTPRGSLSNSLGASVPAEPKSYWPCGHEVVNDQDELCRWCPPS